jgi:CHAT domain-containing protein
VLPTDAESEAMTELATTVDVLHVAAHGRHQVENPLFSEIELAGGSWFGYDVEALPRVPAVVVLSACDLGGSTVRWAEEQVGMAAAWLHAGARSVIASPAALNDRLACELQPVFHASLAAGTPPAEALAGLAELGRLPLVCFGSGW